MNLFKDISGRSDRPFWAYCLTSEHHTSGANYPFPTEGIIRFQAFASLACGAQGLVFWPYHLPSNQNEVYSMAPVTQSGDKTPIWYNLKTVISEIKKWEHIFLGSSSTSYLVSRDGQFGDSTGPFASISYDGPGIIYSKIKNGEKSYIVIVSLDPFENQTTTLYVAPGSSYTELGLGVVTPPRSIPIREVSK